MKEPPHEPSVSTDETKEAPKEAGDAAPEAQKDSQQEKPAEKKTDFVHSLFSKANKSKEPLQEVIKPTVTLEESKADEMMPVDAEKKQTPGGSSGQVMDVVKQPEKKGAGGDGA